MRVARRALAAFAVAAAAVTGGACGGQSADPGLEANFRASGAQFVEGPLAADTQAAGPTVQGVNSANNSLYPGVQNKSITGSIAPYMPPDGGPAVPASAVALGLQYFHVLKTNDDGSQEVQIEPDVGYWVLPVDLTDPTMPDTIGFTTRGSFSPLMQPGRYQLVIRGVTQDGTMGPAFIQKLTLADTAAPTTGFVISLSWDTLADLDLHVVAPLAPDIAAATMKDTVEVWSRQRTTLPPPGPGQQPYTPDQIAAAGVLDFDSDSQCVSDGRRNENLVWAGSPALGHYIVRVDAFSLCGNPAARWQVQVLNNGQVVGSAYGEMVDSDTRGVHGVGSGLTVLSFDLTGM